MNLNIRRKLNAEGGALLQGKQTRAQISSSLLAAVRGIDRHGANMTRGTVRTPRIISRKLYEGLNAPLNLARHNQPLLQSMRETWPVFDSEGHQNWSTVWAETHRPTWLVDLVGGLHLDFHDGFRMESLVNTYSHLFAGAHNVRIVDLIERAKQGETVAQVRVTHGFFDHLARSSLYLKSAAGASFYPRNLGKEHATLSRIVPFLSAARRAIAVAESSKLASFYLAPALDNGSLEQADEATALAWLLRREKIYKYVQIQILLTVFGRFEGHLATVASTKQTVSSPESLLEVHETVQDADIYLVCNEALVDKAIQSTFGDRICGIMALPSSKPLAGLFEGNVDTFAAEIARRAQELQRNRPLIIVSQCAIMNANVAAAILESGMTHVALIDIGRALEIWIGATRESRGIYTAATGHVGKFTHLVPASRSKWGAP